MICCTNRPIRACAVVNDMLSFVAFDLTAFYQGVYSGGEEAGPEGGEGNPSGARHGRRQQTRQHGTHVQLQGLHTRPAAGGGGGLGGFDEACELELINH